MKRLALALVLVALSGGAAAAWVRVGGSDYSNSYVDPATIRRTGDMVKMWSLLTYGAVQTSSSSGKQYMSSKLQWEYDCKNEQERRLYLSLYSGQMARWNVVHIESDPNSKWQPVPPGSADETLWKFACRKK